MNFNADLHISKTPGFPKDGITFYDISPILEDRTDVMVRKAGKLPGELHEQSYALEYGEARLSIQASRQLRDKRVVLCDDLLATGGTLQAAAQLVSRSGGILAGAVCIIELTGLKGRDRLDCPVKALQSYEF